ncbi:MAG: glutamyl-tRNA reductase, partial [Candidatus Contendobacter sp.]|nr:glutamyl-tRNA reductase [Candidatus Contendobacter sp.]
DSQVEHFMAWLRTQDSAASLHALRRQAEKARDEALARAQRQLVQGKDPAEVLHILANTLTNRLIHPPCAGLREAAAQGDLEMLKLIKNLYRLDGRNPCR